MSEGATRSMNPAARAVFLALVAATFAAFFVTQRLKHQPTVVQRIELTPHFSPTGHGGLHRERISFRIKQADDVTVTIVDRTGFTVATLTRGRHLPAYSQQSLRWDGSTDYGALAPDGTYRVRFHLAKQDRTLQAPRSFRLTSAAPRPLVRLVVPGERPGTPLVLPAPQRGPVTASLELDGGRSAQLELFRTDVVPARLVRTIPVPRATTRVTVPTKQGDQPLPDGVYLVAITVTGRTGITGSTPTTFPPRALDNAVIPGHAGFTIRHMAVRPPPAPVAPGAPAAFILDARSGPYSWELRRAGTKRILEAGQGTAASLRLRAPSDGRGGLYELTATSGSHSATAPLLVTSTAPHPALIILPAIAWLDGQVADENGDGLTDQLEGGRPVRRDRWFTEGSLPSDPGAVLAFLDSHNLAYDVATDIEVAEAPVSTLNGRSGAVLVGDERFLPPSMQRGLQEFAASGGWVASLTLGALRATVSLDGASISEPTPRAPADIFGARAGTGGSAAQSFNPTPYGKGQIVRIESPGFTRRLSDLANQALLLNTWQLLSR